MKKITSMTFADISKTFDTVWIKTLILKARETWHKWEYLFD
jgi:hypothetical protein